MSDPSEKCNGPQRGDKEATESKGVVDVGNYDVLLEETKSGTLRLLSCPHVGNNRLEVLLLMNRNEFEAKVVSGDDTNSILDKLVDIVTKQCVPPGRFLVLTGDYDPDQPYNENEWEQIEIGKARQFLNIALFDSDRAGLAGFPTRADDDTVGEMPATSIDKSGGDSTKKRGRRSSLLRRSVSESFVRKIQSEEQASEFGKKKTTNRRHSSFWSIRKQNAPTKVSQTEDLDILFNYEQTALLPGHVGNNRLRVLLNIHKEKYEESDESEQNSSLQEWIRTVTQFWGGRFLRQEEEESDNFEILDATQAELALHSVISELSQSTDDALKIAPLSAPLTTTDDTLPGVDKLPPSTLNVQDMRSAAVQSLQKRKKRQGLASRLRNLAASTLTRSSSTSVRPPPPGFAGDAPNPAFIRASSAPSFRGNIDDSGVMSLPTSPTPPEDLSGAQSARNQQRQKRSSSISLPRFLTGRASWRRSQNLAADGVQRDLRQSLEADDLDFGPEAFGETAAFARSEPF